LTSRLFADRYGKLSSDNLIVNIIFGDANRVSANIERLKQDLAFNENQAYIQSPAFGEDYGSATTYIVLFIITAFLMLTGYLLIYNVMYISVSKDVRFFGMLKTIGTTARQIRRIVSGQILRLCLIGLPFGCALAAAVSLLIVPAVLSTSGIETGVIVSFSPVIYIGAVIFAIITALIGAITPAKKAANISPIEALKYTGKEIRKSGVYSSANGKPYKMAIRNIFRNRKRAVVVMLSLFLSIVVFSTAMIIVSSIDINYRINAEYNSDFTLGSKLNNPYPDWYLSEELVEQIKELDGISEIGITTLEPAQLVYSSELYEFVEWYVDWVSQWGNLNSDTAAEQALVFGLQGIDAITLNRINERLSAPIDAEAFERGEIALIRHDLYREGLVESFDNVTAFEIRLEFIENSFEIMNGGYANLQQPLFSNIQNVGVLGILVSNNFLRQYITTPKIQYIDINVKDGYEEQVYIALQELVNLNDVEILSRFAARKALQEARTITLVLGIGISAILGLIGVFNFINVIFVSIMARKREFATLESVGMSKKQMRSMIRNEGIGYAIITILFSATLGNLISYGLFLLVKNVESTMQFTYPFLPILVVYGIILLICPVTPEIAYEGMSKMSLIERLREVE
jgi:putative ABC transport system permease protein